MSTTQKGFVAGLVLGLLAILVSVMTAGNSVDANIGAGLLGFAGIGVAGVCAIGLIATAVLTRHRSRR